MEDTPPSRDTPRPGAGRAPALHAIVWRWFDRNFLELGREMRLSYLPPLMVYMAAGISGLTAIVGTFFVKEYLGLSAAFLAGLGFWAGIPWALKMPVGHVVDLVWRWKSALVFLGAGLIAVSLAIMVMLIGDREAMAAIMPVEAWFVLSELLAPVGFVIQDAVADAMTVEAVPRRDEQGRPIDPQRQKLMHTTMQTLGRVAIIGGTVLVAVINLYLFAGTEDLSPAQKAVIYRDVYLMSLSIPAISVLGVVISEWLKRRERARLTRELDPEARQTLIGTAIVIFVFRAVPGPGPGVNWWGIDVLGFTPQFFSVLGLTASTLTLAGMFIFRRFMADHPITYIVGALTLASFVFSVPYVGMYYGFHEWTARMTGGVVDARFIALVNTALESPLGQIAMIPMLAWIARSAPANLKATYFAVMASFTNLALSLAQLGSKYLNQIFVVKREVKDPVTGVVKIAADYSQLGELLIAATVIALILPFAAILIVRLTRLRTA